MRKKNPANRNKDPIEMAPVRMCKHPKSFKSKMDTFLEMLRSLE